MIRLSGIFLVLLSMTIACRPAEEQQDTIFQLLPSSETNIHFSNDLVSDQQHNIYTDKDFYAGGGVGLADINNNGLLDIYLVSNQGSNRLYLNKGNFEFEDITEEAGVGGSKPWSTGVSFVDVNGNGYMDIYVTNSGSSNPEERKNELFINNGDLTFTESAAEYGLDDSGYSIHAAFFDYNKSGRLDMYLLNNYAEQPIGSYNLEEQNREEIVYEGGDRLYRNDDGNFTDVTVEAGIYSSGISFGLGVSVGDVNRNGWMDIYISNDFFERDYFYINNGDGTFSEVLEEKFSSISTTSMGGDIADLDNDGFPEIFVTDMLPESEERIKTITDFISWQEYQREVDLGYHRKFTRNTLQYNNGDGTFSEIGRYSGVDATDWSWGALMVDFNLSGYKDIFVANGFYKDVTGKDHMVEISRLDRSELVLPDGSLDYNKLVDLIPSTPIPNYLFENLGNMQFANRAEEWGVAQPGFSHGSAFGDLNGNGVPDLVVNNVNGEAFIYKNRVLELYPDRSWLQVVLEGKPPNTNGVGAKVEMTAVGKYWYLEQMPQRSFQSSMDPILHAGFGDGVEKVDTLQVVWPDGRISLLTDVDTRQKLNISQQDASNDIEPVILSPAKKKKLRSTPLLQDVTDQSGIDWTHSESDFNDFDVSPFLFHMRSSEGPPVCVADVTGNGLDDIFAGGAKGQPGALFIQYESGRFEKTEQPGLEADGESEDTACLFVDLNRDGTPELYVGSGSSEFQAGSSALADRLYRVTSNYQLTRLEGSLPRPSGGHKPTGVVTAADIDGDGYPEIFVGERMMPAGMGAQLGYGVPVGGYILKHAGAGQFEDVTDDLAPQLRPGQLKAAGITSAAWEDMNGNGMPDLVVVGEWMPITVFYNQNGQLVKNDAPDNGLSDKKGWWQKIAVADLNGNGRPDIVGGNFGLNTNFRTGPEGPLQMWADDFNRNGRVEQIFASYNQNEGPFPLALRQDLLHHFPQISSVIPSFEVYAGKTIQEVFPAEQLNRAAHYSVTELASIVAWNEGDGTYRVEQFPFRAQLTPMYGILPFEINSGELPVILSGGNLDRVRPQAGPYDAGYGAMLKMDQSGNYQDLPAGISGFFSDGEIRSIQLVRTGGEPLIVVGKNNSSLQFFRKAEE
jgi:enediyne biosynthesis protein E4